MQLQQQPKVAQPESEITEGTQIIFIQNTELAAALIAVGIELRKDPPYTYKLSPKGAKIVTWNFEAYSADGNLSTIDLVKAWKNDIEWLALNGHHPFAPAMLSQKVGRIMKDKALSIAEKEWVQKNPGHLVTRSLESALNTAILTAHIEADVPYVGFKSAQSGAKIYVKRGSKKHEKCAALCLTGKLKPI